MRKKILIFTLFFTMMACVACSDKGTTDNSREANTNTTSEDENTENGTKETSDNGTADLLKAEETSAALFDYELRDDGIYIHKYFGDDLYVVIPEQIEGKDVVGIDEKGFYGRQVKGVVIPGTIKEIGETAFGACDSLETIIIKDGNLKNIEKACFMLCKKLSYVQLPQGLEIIGPEAFDGCESLKRIELPDGVTTIGSAAFYHCLSLEEIELPDSVTSIGGTAFMECPSLKELNVPGSVTTPKSDFYNN